LLSDNDIRDILPLFLAGSAPPAKQLAIRKAAHTHNHLANPARNLRAESPHDGCGS
jgi:hypothetical protein